MPLSDMKATLTACVSSNKNKLLSDGVLACP